MIISREINGENVSFELTEHELFSAYVEQEHEFDKDYVRGLVSESTTEEKIDEIACEMRRMMNKYDVNIDYAFDEACSECELSEEELA